MSFIQQGKTNWKFLIIIAVIASAVGGGILTFLIFYPIEVITRIPPTLICEKDADCINTCCGCMNDDKKCNIECLVLQKRECVCVNGKCAQKEVKTKGEFTLNLNEKAKIIYDEYIGSYEIVLNSVDTQSEKANIYSDFSGGGMLCLTQRTTRDIKVGESINCFSTVECGTYFELINIENTKATFKTWYNCAPPGPSGSSFPKEIIITKDETAGWQTYRNEEYGFEVKYPKDYYATDSSKYSETIGFGKSEDYSIFITALDKPTVLGFHGALGVMFQSETSQKIISSEDIEINGINFKKNYWDFGPTTITAYVTHNQKVYTLSFGAIKNIEQETKIFNQMLSTFRFIGSYTGVKIESVSNVYKLINIKQDGSEEIVLEDINKALPISKYGQSKGRAKAEDDLRAIPSVYSFAKNEQKVYIARIEDGTEISDYLYEYDLQSKEVKKIDTPLKYIFSYNATHRISPDGSMAAVYGDDGVGIFDLINNKEVISLTSGNIDGILAFNRTIIPQENDTQHLFKWQSSTILQYPIYKETDKQYVYQLLKIETINLNSK